MRQSIELQTEEIEKEYDAVAFRKTLKERSYTIENAFRKLPKKQRKELNIIKKKAATGSMRWNAFLHHESALFGRASAFNLLLNIAKDGDVWIFPERKMYVIAFAIKSSVFTVTIDGEFNELYVHFNRPPNLLPMDVERV